MKNKEQLIDGLIESAIARDEFAVSVHITQLIEKHKMTLDGLFAMVDEYLKKERASEETE